jgi:hypothetical protein
MTAPRGWSIVAWVMLALATMTVAVLALAGTDDEGIRVLVRATARTSVVLFSLAFVAAPLARAWPTTASRWLRANRRYLGVSFAASHTVHLVALLALSGWSLGNLVTRGGAFTTTLGGIGYLFVAAMTATSFDRSAAWLGPDLWQRLHSLGAHYLWVVFFLTFAPLVLRSPWYWPFVGLLLATLGLRLAYAAR